MKAFEYKLKECWFYEVDYLSYCIACTCNFLVMDIKKGNSKLPQKWFAKDSDPWPEELNIIKSSHAAFYTFTPCISCKFLQNDNNTSFTFSRFSLRGLKVPLSNCFKSDSCNTVTSTLFLTFFATLMPSLFIHNLYQKLQFHFLKNRFQVSCFVCY